jgi:hypothetical protein
MTLASFMAFFLALIHVEVTNNMFPHFADEFLIEKLRRATQLYLQESSNKKKPSTFLLHNIHLYLTFPFQTLCSIPTYD